MKPPGDTKSKGDIDGSNKWDLPTYTNLYGEGILLPNEHETQLLMTDLNLNSLERKNGEIEHKNWFYVFETNQRGVRLIKILDDSTNSLNLLNLIILLIVRQAHST